MWYLGYSYAKSWACNIWDIQIQEKFTIYLKLKFRQKTKTNKPFNWASCIYLAALSRKDGLGSIFPIETFTNFSFILGTRAVMRQSQHRKRLQGFRVKCISREWMMEQTQRHSHPTPRHKWHKLNMWWLDSWQVICFALPFPFTYELKNCLHCF